MSRTRARTNHVRTSVLAVIISVGLGLPSIAQTGPTKPVEPAKPAAAPEKKSSDPTLDELLGLPGDKGDNKRPEAIDPTKTALDRKLSSAEAAEQFEEAIELMDETAGRLQKSRDTGVATQRIQEDIIRRLDMVIKQAEQNRQRRQQQRQQQQQNQQQQGQQQQQNQPRPSGQREERPDGDSREDAQLPARRDGELRPEAAARGQAWGSLPARIRDALLQGNTDKYSTLYQRWTEEYYRKLAEEGKR